MYPLLTADIDIEDPSAVLRGSRPVSVRPVPNFAREDSASVIDEIKPLLQAHWQEITHWHDIPMNPNWDAYLAMEAKGVLRIFTIRAQSSLVGYAIFWVSPSTRSMQSLQAKQDVLFLLPEHRRGRIGMRFIDWCDSQLRAEGVQVVLQHVKAAHDFGPMLERLGYELIDKTYGRRLDGR